MPTPQKFITWPRLRAGSGMGEAQLQQAGPGQGGFQRDQGLVGKLRSAGIRHKGSKCFQNKRQLRDTRISGMQNRGIWEQRHKGGASARGELSLYRQAD